VLFNLYPAWDGSINESSGESMCPLEALRRGIDTPEIREAAAQMRKNQQQMFEMAEKHNKSFGRARMLPNGCVEYAKKGHEPPPDLDGYQRDPGNAWKFLPLWPKCKKRIQTQSMKQCGALAILTVCANGDCPLKQQQVTFAQCSSCEHKVVE